MDKPTHQQSQQPPRQARVKNKTAAPIQITAEQLLREASERLDPNDPTKRVKQYIDNENVDDYRQRNRKFFEDKLRRDRNQMGMWIKYAGFEESQKDWQRARSVYERALDVDPYNITLFLKYAEMEMKNKHVNLARNIWDRAVTIQPRVDQFWYKWAYMEETLGETEAARQVYERWMEWQPEESIWFSFIKFEQRYKQWSKIKLLFERLISLHNSASAWLAYAKFQENGKNFAETREIFERAVDAIEKAKREPKLFIEFAKFEIHMKEYERARVIYKFALDQFPKAEAEGLYHSYAQFERQYGDSAGIILDRRRSMYIEKVTENPYDYDTWFDYIRLEEEAGDRDVVRDVYERAIANVPPAEEKRLWRRYIYLWIYYAVYEELDARDFERAGAVYKAALDLIPHAKFSFAKLWTLYAHFHLRQRSLLAARKVLGTALGMCPKPKLFKNYIEMEMRLREFDRCRTIYEKYLEYNPLNSATWIAYAQLETALLDEDRARAIYELAISSEMDDPEAVWKAYIDFELEAGRVEMVRTLYERLLERTEHIKVWVSYANFEASLESSGTRMVQARAILDRAHQALKQSIPDRILLLEAWRDLEVEHSVDPTNDPHVQAITSKLPRKEIKFRINGDEEGGEEEEYIEYIFPEDEAKPVTEKFLAMAQKWKKTKIDDQPQ